MAQVAFPDGRVVEVDATPEMTDEQIYQKALAQSATPSAEPPESPGLKRLFGLLPKGYELNPTYAKPISEIPEAAVSGAVGYGAGKALSGGMRLLSKLRPSGVGRVADATRIGQALETSVPPLGPIKPGPEGLMEAAGPTGKARLSAYTGAERAGIAGNLPTSGTGVGYANPRQQLEKLFGELSEAGTTGYSAAGIAKDSLAGAAARRTREEITQDILALLNAEHPGLAAQFRQSQGTYARGAEIQRALKPERVLGSKGFNQGELQREVDKRLKSGSGASYDPETLKAIFRGGQPPRGDRSLGIPVGTGRLRIPLGLEHLAGPGYQSNMGPGGTVLMQALTRLLRGD